MVPSTREIESHSHMDRSITSKSETAYFCRAKLSYEARCEKASIMGGSAGVLFAGALTPMRR